MGTTGKAGDIPRTGGYRPGMSRPPTDPEVVSWYEHVDDEEHRLQKWPHTRLEEIRTRELITGCLGPAPMDVLDVGGAAGAYAGWLAGMGHRVHLVDPVPRHVAAASRLPGVTAELGDARALTAADAAYDLVLAMGPLYHLAERADRVVVLREAARAARPGGRVVASAIGRYQVVSEYVLRGGLDEHYLRVLDHLVTTGENRDDLGFPLRHAHTWDELRDEALDAGLTEVEVYGLEGPVGHGIDLVPPERAEAAVTQAVTAARLLQTDRRVVDQSPHLLVIGRAP